MEHLNSETTAAIADQILSTISYSSEIRRIFWSDINAAFKAMQPASATEMIQLDSDINALNRTPRLTDGKIPFESWLEKAARYLKPYPDAALIVQHALGNIGLNSDNLRIVNPVSPSEEVIRKVQEEKTIHQNDMVSFSFLESGLTAGKSVARIRVQRYDEERPRMLSSGPAFYLGTGWLLAKDLIITNHHVICARENNEPGPAIVDFDLQASHTFAEFDYNTENREGSIYALTALLAKNPDLDYVVFRIAMGEQRSPLSLHSEQTVIIPGTAPVVNIIQHPYGYAKKVALRNNNIYDTPYPKIRYFTDTGGGSSGSPVFNDKWEVVALHRASSVVDNVNYQGQKTAWINEGIQIHAIITDLQTNYASLWSEISRSSS